MFERAKGGHKSEFAILEDDLFYKGTSLCIPEGGDKRILLDCMVTLESLRHF